MSAQRVATAPPEVVEIELEPAAAAGTRYPTRRSARQRATSPSHHTRKPSVHCHLPVVQAPASQDWACGRDQRGGASGVAKGQTKAGLRALVFVLMRRGACGTAYVSMIPWLRCVGLN